MIRNLKALVLAAFACMAMGAVFASAASAVENPDGEFTAGHTAEDPTATGEHTPAIITGTQYGAVEEDIFETPNSKVECTDTGVHFESHAFNGTAKALTVTLTYTECEANGLATTVQMNGCHYKFTQPEMIDGTEHETWTGTVDLICPEEEVVELETFLFGGHTSHSFKVCTSTIMPEEGLSHVVYHNRDNGTDPDDVTIDVTAAGVDVEEHGSNCPDGDTEPVEAEYRSKVTAQAKDPLTGELIDGWISTASE